MNETRLRYKWQAGEAIVMQVIDISSHGSMDASALPAAQVIALGDFDGVHLGHQEVIRRALDAAGRLHLPAAVLTFDPHPRSVLGIEQYRRLLTPRGEKIDRLAALGVDRAYFIRFDREFASWSPERFVADVLLPFRTNTAVVGFDFTFGHRGQGTADLLRLLGQGRFAVEIVSPCHLDGEKVSSRTIREDVQEGRIAKANRFLGRPYSICGKVVAGEGRGRTIGVPTANIEPSEPYVIPCRGVYAVRVRLGGSETVNGVMNIGVKPTFSDDGTAETLEVHLFDFSRSIYGESVAVEFIDFVRPERKFASAQELVARIGEDMAEAKRILSSR